MYKYRCKIIRVIDGDTVDVDIDLGFGIWLHKERVRLFGIDTPESRTRDLEEKKRGLAAKDRLVEMLESNDNKFILQSYGIGKYGRCLAELFIPMNGEETCINKQLILEGHGVEYFGGKR